MDPVKLLWFHLMPYPDLPEDFKQKYRSVWVDVPSHLFDPAKAHEMYTDYLDELEYAAQVRRHAEEWAAQTNR